MSAEGKDAFPQPFGRYTLIQRLATGGMAEVFKAKIVATHGFEKLLVIKRILPHLAADKNFVSMFIDEAKLTAQLVHPKIVQVTDFGDVDGQFFIALEFVDGFDALALLRAGATKKLRLPVPISIFIVMEILDALDFAHNAKDTDGKPMRLVHRDISPSNVFIARRGDVKLGDFGIAHAQERESKTQAGTLKGKYGYMSPEQVVGGKLDGRSDVFAVGIVLAEMLMGRRLFTAPNDLDVLLMVRDGRLDRLDKHLHDVPAELDQIVRKSLKKKLNERYQSAAEFRDALADLLFRCGFRVGPPDVGRLAADLLDQSPASLPRLQDLVKKWEMKGPATGVGTSPPPVSGVTGGITGGGTTGSSFEALTPSPGMAVDLPPRTPVSGHTAPPSASQAGARASSHPPLPGATPSYPPPPGPPAVHAAPGASANDPMAAALANLLSQPLSVVDLDHYTPGAGPPPGSAAPRAAPGYPAAAPAYPAGYPGAYPGPGAAPDNPHATLAPPPAYPATPQPAPAPGYGAAPYGYPSPPPPAPETPFVTFAPTPTPPPGRYPTLAPPPGPPPPHRYPTLAPQPAPAAPAGASPYAGAAPGYARASTAATGVPIAVTPPAFAAPGALRPDIVADLSEMSPMRALAELAVARESGMVRFEGPGTVKDVYLNQGAPIMVSVNGAGDRLAEYLVTRQFLTRQQLAQAISQVDRFGGRLGDALSGLGMMKPGDIYRLASQQLREQIIDMLAWTDGRVQFFRGQRPPTDPFPLTLDVFEMLGAGALTLSVDFLQGRVLPMREFRPRKLGAPRVGFEQFRIGALPREVYNALDGSLTLSEWMRTFSSPRDLENFLRGVYLLVECGLARFE